MPIEIKTILLIALILFAVILLSAKFKENFSVVETDNKTILKIEDLKMISPIVLVENQPISANVSNKSRTVLQQTMEERYPESKLMYDDFLQKLSSITKLQWDILEVLDVEKNVKFSNIGNYKIRMFITQNETPFELTIDVDYNTSNNALVYNKITLFDEIKQFENANDTKHYNYFKIENILGLLSPFKSSPTLIFTESPFKDPVKKVKFSCLGNDNLTEAQCSSSGGIWDKPVISPFECPFYKKNTHYDNKRGGNINGYCELPSGMVLKGYRFYDIEAKPLCYNCKSKPDGGVDYCCDDQKDINLYPKLKGDPDYQFPNDKKERDFNSRQIIQTGLKID